jgi:hypothetical protein
MHTIAVGSSTNSADVHLERICRPQDLDQLGAWLRRAAVADAARDLFD